VIELVVIDVKDTCGECGGAATRKVKLYGSSSPHKHMWLSKLTYGIYHFEKSKIMSWNLTLQEFNL
jgi:hypothetical protein